MVVESLAVRESVSTSTGRPRPIRATRDAEPSRFDAVQSDPPRGSRLDWIMACWLPFLAAAAMARAEADAAAPDATNTGSLFAKDNLVAWCIVPFDAKKRGPQERAAMLDRLGLRRVAYDWRAEHVPTFEEEILAYRDRGLEYFAFWSWHPAMEPLIRKHGIRPQIWCTNPSPREAAQDEAVAAAASQLRPMAAKAIELGCAFGLYNHGGWGGEPSNLVAVCQRMREQVGSDRIGIVYNFHHGHQHIADFADVLTLMRPYLLCVNINGMNDGAQPKILPLGQGTREREMLRVLRASGYRGPIGILDHREDTDAEDSLRANLDGMKSLLKELGDEAALRTYD